MKETMREWPYKKIRAAWKVLSHDFNPEEINTSESFKLELQVYNSLKIYNEKEKELFAKAIIEEGFDNSRSNSEQ